MINGQAGRTARRPERRNPCFWKPSSPALPQTSIAIAYCNHIFTPCFLPLNPWWGSTAFHSAMAADNNVDLLGQDKPRHKLPAASPVEFLISELHKAEGHSEEFGRTNVSNTSTALGNFSRLSSRTTTSCGVWVFKICANTRNRTPK